MPAGICWVQCHACNVWRQLTEAPSNKESWCCWMHPDPFFAGCDSLAASSCSLPNINSSESFGSSLGESDNTSFSAPQSPTAEAIMPDDWVRCSDCGRWRRLPAGNVGSVDASNWCCALHPDPYTRCCSAGQSLTEQPSWGDLSLTSSSAASVSAMFQGFSDPVEFIHHHSGRLL